jgi:DNA-binding transcriptional LysR family regulator
VDLNDLRYFALIVEHGSFSAAARVTHLNKSKLSRRIAVLEEELGARLLQRSTRRLALTEAGRAFHEHCVAMVVEADAAREAVARLRTEPSGVVRMTCPVTMAQYYVAQLIGEFMANHRKVRIELEATERVVNLIEERIDIALGLRAAAEQPGLVVRKLASVRFVLVASPTYVSSRGDPESPDKIASHDTIGPLRDGPIQHWTLVNTDGREMSVTHSPRLLCSDFAVQYQAAAHGVGMALLPLRLAANGIEEGTLVRVARTWATPEEDIQAVIASRRGMLPSVRALLDHLAARLPKALSVRSDER